MKRNAISDLIHWKNSEDRKPLVMRGARQVGKTWLMQEFGKNYYHSVVYFNFDEEDALKSIFETNKNPQRIIELLSLIAGEKYSRAKHSFFLMKFRSVRRHSIPSSILRKKPMNTM